MTTTLVHPWTSRRKRWGLTQLQLSEKLNVSRHYVIRSEQALFAMPPPRVVEEFAKLMISSDDVNSIILARDRLRAEYYEYQRNTRLFTKNHYQNFEGLLDYIGDKHPLIFWRETQNLSRMGLCKALCLHQDMIRDYELNKQRHVPQQLIDAASLMGWELEPLTRAVAAWRIRCR